MDSVIADRQENAVKESVPIFSGRSIAGGALVLAAVAITLVALLPIAGELDRVQPLMAELEAQAGGNLSCNDWYQIGTQTDGAQASLIGSIVNGGRDIYLWPLTALPVLLTSALILLFAWAQPDTPIAKMVIRSAVVLTIIGVFVLGPFGHEYNTALQCLLE